jgi:hypothetical protein
MPPPVWPHYTISRTAHTKSVSLTLTRLHTYHTDSQLTSILDSFAPVGVSCMSSIWHSGPLPSLLPFPRSFLGGEALPGSPHSPSCSLLLCQDQPFPVLGHVDHIPLLKRPQGLGTKPDFEIPAITLFTIPEPLLHGHLHGAHLLPLHTGQNLRPFFCRFNVRSTSRPPSHVRTSSNPIPASHTTCVSRAPVPAMCSANRFPSSSA